MGEFIGELFINAGYDKQMHFVFFFILSFSLGILLLIRTDEIISVGSLRLLWITLLAIGTIEEYRQYFLPERSAEFLDAVANLCGITSGLLIPFLIAYFRLVIQTKRIGQPLKYLIEWLIFIPFYYGLWIINEIPF